MNGTLNQARDAIIIKFSHKVWIRYGTAALCKLFYSLTPTTQKLQEIVIDII